MGRDVEDTRAPAMAIATAEVQILADTSKFERDLRKKLRQAGQASGKQYAESFNKSASKAQAKASTGDPKQHRTSGEKAGREFSKSFEKAASGSKSSGKGLLSRITKGVEKDGTRAGKSWGSMFAKGALTPIAAVGKSITAALDAATGIGKSGGGGMFGPMAIAAGLAASALIPLIGYLGEIPAMVSGAAASVATLTVAFKGFGEAVKAGMSGDMGKFNESLQKLAPAAQQVAKDIVGMKPAFDGLQKSVQGAFFGPLVGQLGQLSQVVSGPLQKGMTGLAGAFGEAAKSLVQFMGSRGAQDSIQGIFDGITASVQKLTPSLQPLVKGFMDFAAVGAKSLGNLAPLLANIGNSMSKFAGDGGLDRMLAGAAQAAQQLGQAFAALWPGLKAAVDVFNIIGASVRAVLIPAFGALSQAMVTLQPVFAPIFAVLGQALQAVIPPAAAAVTGLAQVIAAALLPALQVLAPVAGQALGQLGPGLTQAIVAVTPALVGLAAVIGQGLAGALRLIVPLVQGLVPVFVGTFNAIVPPIQAFVGFLINTFRAAGAVLAGDWGRAWELMKAAVSGFGDFIAKYLNGLIGVIFAAGRAIIDGFGAGMRSAWDGVASWVTGIGGWIAANKGPISYDRRLLVPHGRAIMEGFNDGLQQGWSSVQQSIGGFNTSLSGGFGGAPGFAPRSMSPTASPFATTSAHSQNHVDNSRTTTVGPPTINVHAAGADPARVARRTANRLARLATA